MLAAAFFAVSLYASRVLPLSGLVDLSMPAVHQGKQKATHGLMAWTMPLWQWLPWLQ
jgi:hypothetical protein